MEGKERCVYWWHCAGGGISSGGRSLSAYEVELENKSNLIMRGRGRDESIVWEMGWMYSRMLSLTLEENCQFRKKEDILGASV